MRASCWKALLVGAATIVLSACPSVRMPEIRDARAVPPSGATDNPIKVHLRSGQLLVLASWRDLPGDTALEGRGRRYDEARRLLGPFDGRVPRDSIALLEITRQTTAHPVGSIIMGTYTVLAGVVTIACLADPKSCFGSCPTFYLQDRDDRPIAEGFSGSVARSLEATDLDDLAGAGAHGPRFAITMRNEALETHVVQSLRLIAVERPAKGIVAADGAGRLWVASEPVAPLRCDSRTGDCAGLVARRDRHEWSTRADSTNLGTLDSLDLVFPAVSGNAALVATTRQAFVSTYVFYQSLAWAGSRAGDLLAAVERGGIAAFPGAWTMMRQFSRVEVLIQGADGAWLGAGTLGEPGPIAADRQIVPLATPAAGPVHVRLRFARGAWRFDEMGLAQVGEPLHAVAIEPARVERDGASDTVALARLRDPARSLITSPGDRYRIVFELPDDGRDRALFLESTGHYYEWMRPEWLREENPAMLALLATRPQEALRRMAPAYSRLEPQLEAMFWASRFGRN